jgi:hypothetical protein
VVKVAGPGAVVERAATAAVMVVARAAVGKAERC